MSVQRLALSPTAQAAIDFGAYFLFNLAVVALPSGAPKWVGLLFFVIGLVAILVRAELPSTVPPTIPTQTAALYLSVASVLTAINGYIAFNYSTYWYYGFIIGIIGAVIAAIQQIVSGQLPPTPPALGKH